MTKEKETLFFPVELTPFSLAALVLAHTDYEFATQLIKELDKGMAEWEITLDLYKHFRKLKKQYDKEEEENPVGS